MLGLQRGTVELYSYEPEWKRHYEEEVERLESIASDRFLDFEHVGSTAIEGIAAKPITDLIAVVDDVNHATDLIPVLEVHGYEYRPNATVPDRLFFAKGPRSNRTHYRRLTEKDSSCYREERAFRDYLRAHPDVAAGYEQIKRELADEYADDWDQYTEGKAEFIAVLEQAMGSER